MPIPVPTPSKVPRQLGPPATITANPEKRPSSSSSSVSSGSRRHTSSPPTSRPTSSSRYSPPQTSRDRNNSSPSLSSRPPSKRGDRSPPLNSSNKMQKQDNGDAAKMPPPPPPPTGRAISLRSTTKPGEKRRIASVSNKARADEEKASVATATGKGPGKLLALKPSASSSKLTAKGIADSEPSKRSMSLRSRVSTVDKGLEKNDKTGAGAGDSSGGSLGRAMSLRSSTRTTVGSGGGSAGTGANVKTESISTARTRGGAGTRPRPASMYGATTSKSDLTGMSTGPSASSSTTRRPSTSSNSNPSASMPPPSAPVKGHKKSSSVTSASIQSSNAANAPTGINANSRPTTAGSTKPKRPAFSALNQDFTAPANQNPPPPTTRSRVIPPPPLDTPTIHAQTQLLQLLTLHSSSTAVYQQLIASATTTLKSRFEKLSARHYDARETSLKKQKRHNLDSLAAVVNNAVPGKKRRDTTKSPEERVQAFSEGIKRIDAMRSGEFRKLCGVFGEWIAGYNPRAGGATREKWIDGIGDAWRRECVGISRRLEVSIAGVDGVAGVLSDYGEEEAVVTTVTRVAEGYKDLAEGMLEEVEMMRRMEIEVVERERMELKRRISVILDVGVDSSYNSVAVWAAC